MLMYESKQTKTKKAADYTGQTNPKNKIKKYYIVQAHQPRVSL